MPIAVPSGVKVMQEDSAVTFEGPKGKIVQVLPVGVACQMEGSVLHVRGLGEGKGRGALQGLVRSLLANAVEGVSGGFRKDLQIEGIGYRAQLKGRELHLTLGYSHPVVYSVCEEVNVEVQNQVKIAVSGANRQLVGQVAAEIRALRPPEPYKGKGIRYSDEVVKRKAGKTGA